MIFTTTHIQGVAILDIEPRSDHRGFFARTYCREEFLAHGLEPMIEQCNVSYNYKRGTLRGMHMQVAPHLEAKLVRCTRGAALDIIVDMRRGSPTRLQHVAVELTADNRRAVFIPPGFAHGFQTLADDTEIFYQVSAAYAPQAERGIRYNDPDLNLPWPLPVSAMTEKDRNWPLLSQRDPKEFDHI